MRSFVTKAVLATMLATSTIAGTYAASAAESRVYKEEAINQNRTDDNAATPDTRIMNGVDTSITTGSVKAMPSSAMMYRPRLAHIVREVGAANHRIWANHDRGRLTQAEYKHLRREARMIRADALRVADMHSGRLPMANYHRLQQRVAMLNVRIHRDART